MPDVFGILADGAVRGELAGGGDVHEALAAKGDAVAVVMAHAQTGLFVAVEVVEDEILIRLMPACTFEQGRIELLLGLVGPRADDLGRRVVDGLVAFLGSQVAA